MPSEVSSSEPECRCGPGQMCGACFESRVQPEDVPKILQLIQSKDSEPSSSDFVRCRCDHFQMNHRPFTEGGCRNCSCDAFKLASVEPEEPPLTPEEEEELPPERGCCGNPNCTCEGSCDCDQAPEDWECANESGCYRQHTNDCAHGCRHAADELTREANEPPPPQPDRRPPYAVAYSVQGHLYEVALPGDATVQATDGALIIRHHLGPVAGIVQVLPVINKESA